MKNKNYLERIEEAEDILKFAYIKLCEMTTDEFSKGGDKEIRKRIEKFLDIDYEYLDLGQDRENYTDSQDRENYLSE